MQLSSGVMLEDIFYITSVLCCIVHLFIDRWESDFVCTILIRFCSACRKFCEQFCRLVSGFGVEITRRYPFGLRGDTCVDSRQEPEFLDSAV